VSIKDLPTLNEPLLHLTRIFAEEGCDKFHRHRYDIAYSLILERLRFSARSVLEIGVYKGQSLRSWKRYFSQAKIVGVDLRPRPVDLPEEIVYCVADQGDQSALESVAAEHGQFDVIIEDGSHRMDHQIQCAEWLWPHVRVGGVYVCEDLHTSELTERIGPDGDDFRRRFNPTKEDWTAREYFLDDTRNRCIRRGDGGGRLVDRITVWSSCMMAWIKVHDGDEKKWP
jgi:hypothetical protein